MENKMLDRFKEWLEEVERVAIDKKKNTSAKENGDESLWKKKIWHAPEKKSGD